MYILAKVVGHPGILSTQKITYSVEMVRLVEYYVILNITNVFQLHVKLILLCYLPWLHAIASGMTFNWRLSGRAICINHCTFVKHQWCDQSSWLAEDQAINDNAKGRQVIQGQHRETWALRTIKQTILDLSRWQYLFQDNDIISSAAGSLI